MLEDGSTVLIRVCSLVVWLDCLILPVVISTVLVVTERAAMPLLLGALCLSGRRWGFVCLVGLRWLLEGMRYTCRGQISIAGVLPLEPSLCLLSLLLNLELKWPVSKSQRPMSVCTSLVVFSLKT